jgi:hypothetical protein
MKRKFHVRFCNGGGAGDRSTDRNQLTALDAPTIMAVGYLWFWFTQGASPATAPQLNSLPLGRSTSSASILCKCTTEGQTM